MAELNFENHPLEKVVSSMITLCDSVIVIGSKASVHESYCQIVARKVEDIRELLESVMHFMFYDRPIRFILPFVNQTLRTAEKELNEFCLLLPILARTTLVLKLPKLERDLIDVSGDLFWIEELLRKGYRLQRVEQNGGINISYTVPKFTFINHSIAIAWCAIVSLFKNRLFYKVTALKDIGILVCGKQTVVDEGVIMPLLCILGNTEEKDEVRAASATALMSLVGAVETAKINLSTPEAMILLAKMLEPTTNKPILIAIVELVSTIATNWVTFRNNFGEVGGTLGVIRLLESGQQQLLGLKMQGETSSSIMRFSRDGISHDPVEAKMKLFCVEAIDSLTEDCFTNCSKVGETSGLVFFVRLLQQNNQQLQHHCLNIILHMTAVAEKDYEFKRKFFGVSKAARETIDCLIDIIGSTEDEAQIKHIAIKAIGNLSTVFVPSSDNTKILFEALVRDILHQDPVIRSEVVTTLEKFTNPKNQQHVRFSGLIVDNGGVGELVELVRRKESTANVGATIISNLSYAQRDKRGIMEALLQIVYDANVNGKEELDVIEAIDRLGSGRG